MAVCTGSGVSAPLSCHWVFAIAAEVTHIGWRAVIVQHSDVVKALLIIGAERGPFFYAHIAYYFTSHRGILSTGYEACLAKAVAELLLRYLQVSISAVYPDTQGDMYGAAVFFVTLYFGRAEEALDTCAALR